MLARITGIRQLKGRSGRCEVALDDGSSLKLLPEVVLRLGLRQGQEVDQASVLAAAELDETVRAREYALDLLSRSARSEKQIRDKLRQRGVPQAVAESVLEGLRRSGLLDDAAYSRTYVSARLADRPMGRRALMQELAQRGVDRQTAQGALEAGLEGRSEEDLAVAAAAARWPRLAHLPREDALRKLLAYLARRGFSQGVCWRATRRVADQDAVVEGDDLVWPDDSMDEE
ncbi:MAG: regulatory protein RecX [Bacillota bacterium]